MLVKSKQSVVKVWALKEHDGYRRDDLGSEPGHALESIGFAGQETMTTGPQHGDASSSAQDVANLGLVRPPFVYLASLVSGSVIQLARPLAFLPGTLAVPLGVLLIAAAIAPFSYSVTKFRAAGTPVPARKPTTAIVRTGPYRFSRNPI